MAKIKRKSANFLSNTKSRAKKEFDSAKEKLEETKDRTEHLIKKHPLTSVAIAAAVGALVALGVNALARQERRHLLRRFKDYF
jgi:ElaB/YqjD/DUF883 family membrane-anchored ribosome-binding protein